MGQCGCGDLVPRRIIKIAEDKYLCLEVYPGCDYCDDTIGVSLHFFNKKGFNEFLTGMIDVDEPEFNEYGGDIFNEKIFSVRDLGDVKDINLEDYEDIQELFEGNGLRLVQNAIAKNKR